MSEQVTRRETLRRALAATSLLALAPDLATPALAQGETEVPFTDIPATFNPGKPGATTRLLDIRKIDGPFTPKEQFFAIQHFNPRPLLAQPQLQRARDRALARAAHAGEPQRESLVHLWCLFRFRFRQDIATHAAIGAEVNPTLFFGVQLPPPPPRARPLPRRAHSTVARHRKA